jgi:hypothetical protein
VSSVALAPLAAWAATPPSAPTSLTAVASGSTGDVTLSWSPPTSSGSSPISDYGYNLSTDGGKTWTATAWFGSTALTASVVCANSGIASNGKGCQYRVRARSAGGTGAAGSRVITWVLPSVPRSLVATPTDASLEAVALSWVAPVTTGAFALAYSVQTSNDGGAYSTVTTTDLSITVPCTGAVSCAYRVFATNGQGAGPMTTSVPVRTVPGQVQSLSALTQSSDRGTGVSTVNLSWYTPTTGMPADHFDLQSCTIALGALAGCGPTGPGWSSTAITGPFATPVSVARTCTAGVATCYWRVRAVNENGGAGVWRTVNLQPWAVTVSVVSGPEAGQVSVSFTGPAESGPNGSPKFYKAFACSAACGSDSSWVDTGLTIAYPPSDSSPHFAGAYPCGANVVCQVRMQFTDGRGNSGILSPTASARGPVLTIDTPADNAVTNDTTPTIAGTCTSGAGTVDVTVSPVIAGPSVPFSASCSGAGTWTGDVPSELSDATYTASATQVGHPVASNTRTFTVDTADPVVTLATPADGATLTSGNVSFSGTCTEIGTDNVSIAVTGPPSTSLTASCVSGGTWAVSHGLPNGAYTAQASQTDAAGNVGSSSTNAFTVSSPLPTVTLDSPSNGGYANTNPTTISGLCTTSAGTVTVVVSGPTSGSYTASCVAGAWSRSVVLADGAYSATATQTDAFGNVGSSGTKTFTVDTVAPTISATATKADTTSYVADTWTNQTVTVHYTCADTGGSGVASCTSNQVFSADGTTATTSGTATDQAGNSATAGFGPIKIDKTSPSIAVVFPVTTKKYNTTRWNAGCSPVGVCGTASDTAPPAGSGLASVTVRVQRGSDGFWWNGTAFVAGSTNAVVTGLASWNAALPASALTNGVSYTVTATATDGAGNTSNAVSAFTYDTTRPTVTTASVTNQNGVVQITGVDTLTATFSEALDPTTVPATATLTLQRGGSGNTMYGISGVTNGLIATSAKGYVASGGGTRTVTFDGTVALSVDRKTITFTVTTACQPSGAGSPCLTLQTAPDTGAWTFAPASSLLDDAGNAADPAVVFTAAPATAMF